ncbi:unnamed protein product [Gordionus sp. m RMFG-2023]
MVILFAICWCPINILVFVMHFVFEDENNSGNIDITYLTFIWFAFLSTCINPLLFLLWQRKKVGCKLEKKSKGGYFNFNNRLSSANPNSDIFLECSKSKPTGNVKGFQNVYRYQNLQKKLYNNNYNIATDETHLNKENFRNFIQR